MKPFSIAIIPFAAAAAMSMPAAYGQVVLQLASAKDFQQTGPSGASMQFRRGLMNVNLRDGSAWAVGCFGLAPLPQYIPEGVIGCPLGTTGYVAFGDGDGDGLFDDAGFWSLSSIGPATLIEPFQEGLCSMIAAPPSQLPRTLSNFQDQSWLIYYNLHTATILEYVVTEYDLDREYAAGAIGWQKMDKELVTGQYVFSFPLRNRPVQSVPVAVTHHAMPEGYGLHHRYPKEDFHFVGGTWDSNGFYLMDPNLGGTISWTGNNVGNVSPSADVLRFMILDELPLRDPASPMRTFDIGAYDQREDAALFWDLLLDIDDLDPTVDIGNDDNPNVYTPYEDDDEFLPAVEFPPTRVPLQIPSPYTQQYSLAPGFFRAGEQKVIQVRFDRILGTTSAAYDSSVRLFHANVRFVNTYAGYASLKFPSGEDPLLTAANGDYDGDGVSNIDEMTVGTDPADDADVPVPLAATADEEGDTVSFTYELAPDVHVNDYLLITDTGTNQTWKVSATNSNWIVTRETEVQIVEDPVTDREFAHTIVTVTVRSRAPMLPDNLVARVGATAISLK